MKIANSKDENFKISKLHSESLEKADYHLIYTILHTSDNFWLFVE
jgi:hypothetical protein